MTGTLDIPNRPTGQDTRSISAVIDDFDALLQGLNAVLTPGNLLDGAAIANGTVMGSAIAADAGIAVPSLDLSGFTGDIDVDPDGTVHVVNVPPGAPIPDDSIVANKLDDGTIADKLGLSTTAVSRRGYAEVLTEEFSTVDGLNDLATVGPAVNVHVPTNGLVVLFASVEMKRGSAGLAQFGLIDDADNLIGNTIAQTASASYVPVWPTPGPGAGGVSTLPLGGFLVFPATPGNRSYRLLFGRTNGSSGTAGFKNRKLWIFTLS